MALHTAADQSGKVRSTLDQGRGAAGRPDHYRLMFGPVLADRSAFPEFEEAVRVASEVILGGLGGTDVAAVGAEAVHRIGTAAWAMVHGLAVLVIDGQLEALVEDEVERYRGILAMKPRAPASRASSASIASAS